MVAHLTGQPEVFKSQGAQRSGQRGSPSIVYGGPASEETVQVWLLSPEKEAIACGSQGEGFLGTL